MPTHYLEHPKFNPDQLLDTVKEWLELRSDGSLAQRLHVGAPSISKIRHRRSPISAELLLSMHEETGLSIRELRLLAGDFRTHTGKSAQPVEPVDVPKLLSDPARLCAEMAIARKQLALQQRARELLASTARLG